MAIVKPFAYIGAKDRFWEEIKQIFVSNRRPNYYDPFAGGCYVPVNIKAEYPCTYVHANVFDPRIKALFATVPGTQSTYIKLCRKIYGGVPKRNALQYYLHDKPMWEQLKHNFRALRGARPHEGTSTLTEDETAIADTIIAYDHMSTSLRMSFWSDVKAMRVKRYFDALQHVDKITYDPFCADTDVRDSFVLLDPPYITSTLVHKTEGHGYSYATDEDDDPTAREWTTADNQQIIDFINRNAGHGNYYLIFGTPGNDLQTRLHDTFGPDRVKFTKKEYNHQAFGKVKPRAEWWAELEL